MESQLPERIGAFRITGVLGQGGMGLVYLAEQDDPKRRVALKVIRAGVMGDEMRRRFRHEAQVLSHLQHPGIAQIFSVGMTDASQPYFAMEYVDGQPLTHDTVTVDLTLRERLALLSQVCFAIHHAHQRGVIHRDLKPSNILVDSTGRVRILDFGVARATGADVQVTTMGTDVGQLIGTLPYMSPEQVAGDPLEIDIRSDIYALGVVGFELLVGRLPYDLTHKAMPEAIRVISEVDPPPLSSVDRMLRGDVETIIAKALEKDRSRRYQSASELAGDIQRYLEDRPILARPVSTFYHLKKYARRNKAIVVGTVATVLALMAGLVGTSTQAARATRASKTAVAERDRAERRFEQVRELANAFQYGVEERIRNLPGATAAREYLVETALAYLDNLAREVGEKPELLYDLAAGYGKVGMIQGDPSGPNLGNLIGGMKNCEKGIRFYDALLEANPDDLFARHRQAMAYTVLGEIKGVLGWTDEALQVYEKSFEAMTSLVERDPDDAKFKEGLAHAALKRGHALSHVGQFDAALKNQRRSLRIRQALIEADPTNKAHQTMASASHIQVGERLRELGRPRAAMEHFKESLRLRQKLAESDADNAIYQRAVANAHERIGNVQGNPVGSNLGDKDAALGSYQKSMAIRRKLAAADPSNAEATRDLSVSYEKLGDMHKAFGQFESALSSFKESFRIRAARRTEAPKDNEAVRDLAVSATKLGETYAALGQVAEARRFLTQGLELREERPEGRSRNARAQRDLGVSYYKLGVFVKRLANDEALPTDERLKHWREAKSWYEKCHSVFSTMAERGILLTADEHIVEETRLEAAACDEMIQRLIASPES